jgi:hypothetical protein
VTYALLVNATFHRELSFVTSVSFGVFYTVFGLASTMWGLHFAWQESKQITQPLQAFWQVTTDWDMDLSSKMTTALHILTEQIGLWNLLDMTIIACTIVSGVLGLVTNPPGVLLLTMLSVTVLLSMVNL